MEGRGKFIVLEGVEGCGKSTQVRLLAKRLETAGEEVEVVRDPGGTPIGDAIRAILLDKQYEEMSVHTEFHLYMASRMQLLEERILPALDAGDIVISDRFLTSTIVYQGVAGGLDVKHIEKMYNDWCRSCQPDLVVIVDVPVEVGRKRLDREHDRMESKSREYHERVRQGYLAEAKRRPALYVVVDGSRKEEEVAEEIWKVVSGLLGRNK